MPVERGAIILMRHGQVQSNVGSLVAGSNNEGLTETGKQQAEQSADSLKGRNVTVIYSSPLRRAKQTADIVASALGDQQVHTHPKLVERNLEALRGVSKEDSKALAETITLGGRTYAVRMRDGNDEGIESFPALRARAEETLEEISETHPAGGVLLVTHSVIGRMLYAAYHGLTWQKGLEAVPHFPNAGIIELSGPAEKNKLQR